MKTDLLERPFLRGCCAFSSVLQYVLLKLMDRLILKEYCVFAPAYSVEFYFFISLLQLSWKALVIPNIRKSDTL